MHRVDLSDAVENVDMSLEELQHLLLRSHQQSTVESGSSTVMDVSTNGPHTDRQIYSDRVVLSFVWKVENCVMVVLCWQTSQYLSK